MAPQIKEVRRVEEYKDGELQKEVIDEIIHVSNKLTRPKPTYY